MVLTAHILSVFTIPSSLCLAIKKKPKVLKSPLFYCIDSLFCDGSVLLMKLPILVATSFGFRERLLPWRGRWLSFKDDTVVLFCADLQNKFTGLFAYGCCFRILYRLAPLETDRPRFPFLRSEARVLTEAAVCYLVKQIEKWPVLR